MTRHNSIHSRAMLAALHISRWGATRTDKKVTADVANTHRVNARRAGYYRKHAIDPETPSLVAVTNAYNLLRRRHYHWTMPWGDDGQRILPASVYDKYSADMRLLRAEFDRAVTQFVADYPKLAAHAQQELGSLYDANDYPTDISSKFGVSISIMPLPDAQDFRVDLPDEAISDIRSNIADEMKRTTSNAMREPLNRLFDHIHRMKERLSDPEARFHASLIDGLKDLCELLPAFNITEDESLSDFIKRSASLVESIDADTIREMPEKRSEIAKQAEQIEADMAAFMGSFSK